MQCRPDPPRENRSVGSAPMCQLAPHWFSQSGAGLHSPHHEDRFPIVCVQFYSTYRFMLPMPSFVEDIFTASRPLGWQFKDTSSLSSAYMVSGKRPAFTLLFVLLCVVMCLFSPWLLQDPVILGVRSDWGVSGVLFLLTVGGVRLNPTFCSPWFLCLWLDGFHHCWTIPSNYVF